MKRERSRSRRLRRWARERVFFLVCLSAALPIGAGPIVGGNEGTLISSIGADILGGYGLYQARGRQSTRRDREDRDDDQDPDRSRGQRSRDAR